MVSSHWHFIKVKKKKKQLGLVLKSMSWINRMNLARFKFFKLMHCSISRQVVDSTQVCFLYLHVRFLSSGLANLKLAECNCFSSGLLVNEWFPHGQGCCGFGSPALVQEVGQHLHLAPLPPPAGQIVSLCGCGFVGWCWTLGCAGGRQSADIHLCSNVSGPPQTGPV